MNLFGGLGVGKGLEIQIDIHADPRAIAEGQIVPLDHVPGWKIGKQTFTKSALRNFEKAQNPQQYQQLQQQQQGMYGMPQQQSAVTYVYDSGQDVSGMVHLILPHGKTYDHLGVKIQLLGRISMSHAVYEGRSNYDFVSLSKELQPPCTLYQTQTSIPFHFGNVEKQYETYHGRNVNVRYYVRVLVERKFVMPLKKDQEVIVQVIRGNGAGAGQLNMDMVRRYDQPIKMEVGIEECLHIEFEFQKKYYHLRDCILGKVNFMTVRIKIKFMELAIIRRESCGDGLLASSTSEQTGSGMPSNVNLGGSSSGNGVNGQIFTETQTLTKFEIMDGAPVKGEVIPVRLFLGGIPADLTPTLDGGNNRFSIRYYINLVLVDEVDRRYFKQQEIILWRKDLG